MTIINDYLTLTIKYKNQYSEKTLLLMQVGSFFECYALLTDDNKYEGSNIQEFSDINDLVISKKHILHDGKNVVMAGFGITQLEKYIKRLQEHEYTVVVYTQDSNNKNTTRSLSCIYSPGTYFSNDSTNLTNITTCIWIHYSSSNKLINEKLTIGMASIDIYTGDSNNSFYMIDFIKSPTVYDVLENYLCINNPSECIIVSNYKLDFVLELINCKCHKYTYDHEWIKNISKQKYQYEIIKTFLNNNPESIFTEWNISTQAYCLLIQFIYNHNPNLIKKLKNPKSFMTENKLILANHSLKQLNIIPDYNHSGKLSCLSNLLNNCVTSMGKRAFNYELLNPSINFNYLNNIYNITEHCIDNNLWLVIRNYLSGIKDLSKIYRKIILGKLSPKDFYTIYSNLSTINSIFLHISKDNTLLTYIDTESVSFCITTIQEYIYTHLNIDSCKKYDDLSFDKFSLNNIRDIMLFNNTYSNDLNNNYNMFERDYNKFVSIKQFLELNLKDYEKEEQSNNRKKYENSDYIKIHECPKTEPILIGTSKRLNKLKLIINHLDNKDFDPKSIEIKNYTGSNSLITSPEINSITKNIIKLKEKFLNKLISEFNKFSSNFISKFDKELNTIIDYTTKCDILQNRCYIAETYYYTKPTIIESNNSFLDFKQLRHPLIEKINTNEIYIANDLNFNENNNGFLLYGTNAVGKTSFIKSIGISIIMAQAGLYVPAQKFTYSIYKSIYTRILGIDNIFKGLSTFAVEMTELRSILKNANHNTLILGDEVCSGTESTSALSIFTAAINYLSNNKCSFIFATHFHEIINYEEIKNINTLKLLHMSVIYDKSNDKLIYDRILKYGPGNNMYGLEVCKSLNLPDDFLNLAHNIRNKYNISNSFSSNNLIIEKKTTQYNNSKIKGICEICKESEGTEVHHLTYKKNLQNYIDKPKTNHKANLINICEKCHNTIHKNNVQLKIYKTTNGYELM